MPPHPLVAMALPRWLVKWVFIVVTVALWLPSVAVLATFATVIVTGCDVNEATTHPCVVAGHDIAEALYAGLLMVFLAGPTLPFAVAALVLWIVSRRRSASRRPG